MFVENILFLISSDNYEDLILKFYLILEYIHKWFQANQLLLYPKKNPFILMPIKPPLAH